MRRTHAMFGLDPSHETEFCIRVTRYVQSRDMLYPSREVCNTGQVMRYAGEWKRVVRRLARWIDMERDYKTLDPSFMESVWCG